MTTVVTAAAGNVGRHAVSRLAEAGHTVRAVVRSESSADALRAPSVEPVVADLESGVPPGLFDGADRALLVVPVTESLVRTANALTDAAAAAGLDRVVRVSIDSAFVEGGDVLGRAHAEADRHLAASGLRFTALRPAGFMQNLLGMAPMVQQGVIAAPTGEGEIPFVDAADIAAAAVAVLTGRSDATGPVDLTGPEALSFGDVAEKLSALTGRPVAHVSPSEDEARAGFAAVGLSPWLADAMVANAALVARGAGSAVRDGVERLTGRPPRSLDAFLAEHAAAFQPAS